jgi:tripartite-type tricarboxylate transporter receptor subunit TctC
MVRIIVSAGSVTDGFARLLSDKMTEIWKQQVIVENRPGIAGTGSVAKRAPDGYTLMLASNGHTILGAVNESLPLVQRTILSASHMLLPYRNLDRSP